MEAVQLRDRDLERLQLGHGEAQRVDLAEQHAQRVARHLRRPQLRRRLSPAAARSGRGWWMQKQPDSRIASGSPRLGGSELGSIRHVDVTCMMSNHNSIIFIVLRVIETDDDCSRSPVCMLHRGLAGGRRPPLLQSGRNAWRSATCSRLPEQLRSWRAGGAGGRRWGRARAAMHESPLLASAQPPRARAWAAPPEAQGQGWIIQTGKKLVLQWGCVRTATTCLIGQPHSSGCQVKRYATVRQPCRKAGLKSACFILDTNIVDTAKG